MLESSKNKAPRIRGRYRVAKRVPPKNKAIKIFRFKFVDDNKATITPDRIEKWLLQGRLLTTSRFAI